MPNAFLAPKVFANAGLKLLKNNLVFAKLIDSEGVEKTFKAGVGGTVYVKRPPEFTIRDGATASAQDVVEGEVAVSIDKQKGIDVQFTSQEDTLNFDSLLKSKVLDAAMSQIASQIDSDAIAKINEFHNWVGTPGTTMSSPLALYAGVQRLDELAIPMTDRNAVLTPADGYGIIGALSGNAAQSDSGIAADALRRAKIPMIGNVDSYMTQTMPSLTTGTRAVTGSTVNGAGQNVTYLAARSSFSQSLICAGQISKTFKAGEVFTIAGVNAVNPRTKADLGYLRQFTVLADATSDGAGALTLSIAPAIIISGAYQNSTAAPANTAAITFLGALSTTFRPNAIFHKTAIKLVSAKLTMPFTGEADFATDPETGLTIRYWRYSDGASDTHNHRWDVFYGVTNVDRRLGTRVSG